MSVIVNKCPSCCAHYIGHGCMNCLPGMVNLPVVPSSYSNSKGETKHVDPSNAKEGLRYDEGKAPMDLLCPIAMEGIALVLQKGALKYAEGNWQKGMPWRKVIGCLLRHTFKFMKGIDLDREDTCETCIKNNCVKHTGLPHVDLIACNAMFLCNYYREQKRYDNRFKKESK